MSLQYEVLKRLVKALDRHEHGRAAGKPEAGER